MNMSKSNRRTHTSLKLTRLLLLTTCLATAALTLTTTSAFAEDRCPNEALRVAQASTKLPDCRAYEMVSPPEKNGADIVPHSYKTVSTPDGNGVAFVGLSAFGDVNGTSTDAQYVARRDGVTGTSAWSTHSVGPPAGAPPLLALVTVNWPTFSAFTPDLRSGIYTSWSTGTPAPNVAGVTNLYQVHAIETRAPQVQLVSASSVPLQLPGVFTKLQRQNRLDGASKDLSHVLFQSPYNLTGDGSFSNDGDLYEYADGIGVRRVGRVPSASDTECDDVSGPACVDAPSAQAGIAVSTQFASSRYASGMISDDGSRILFQGPAGPGATGPVYMRENGRHTYQLDASEKTTPESPGNAQVWAMSSDGSRVFFTTSEGLLDSDNDGGSSDLYMYDLRAPAGARLTLVSADTTDNPDVAVTSVVGASADGHYVYFVSDGHLVPDAPADVVLEGLYVWHDGTIRYIGRFENFNLATLNTPGAAWEAITFTRASRVTPDGRHLLFMSTNDDGFRDRGGYAGYDHGTCDYGGQAPCRELYLYSADTGRLACVSCNPRASVATGDALTDVSPAVSASAPTQHLSNALSDDGQHVFFDTVEALVPQDSNGKWDGYEYDTASATVHLISTGTSSADSYFLDASPDGQNVFFVTRQRLNGWDVDDNYDLYDARVNGGFPDPLPPAQPCAGEACRAPLSAAPGAGVPATQVLNGAGNVAAPVVSRPVVKKVSNAQRLSRALKACKRMRSRAHRKKCESQARRQFGKKASKSRRDQ
jgi:hypothetical protein